MLGQCAPGLQWVQVDDQGLITSDNPQDSTKTFVSASAPAYTGNVSALALQAVLVRVNSPATLETVRTFLATHTPPQTPPGPGTVPTPPRTFGEALAIRAVRQGEHHRPARRRRAARLPELLALRPAELEALRKVRQRAARCRDHRGRAGLPELPPGAGPALQHLRDVRPQPDRDLPGNRHPGLQPVPQALDQLLALRGRGTAEGGNAR